MLDNVMATRQECKSMFCSEAVFVLSFCFECETV